MTPLEWASRIARMARRAMLLLPMLTGVPASAQTRTGATGATHCAAAAAQTAACLAARLTSGRLLVRGISFQPGTAVLDARSTETLRALAAALQMTTGTYLVESYTSAVPDAQSLSDRRAAAVRSWLLAAGVDASRLYAAGFGATSPRPPSPEDRSLRDRIEISRVS